MPAEQPRRQSARREQSEDALDVREPRFFLLIVCGASRHLREEGGRGQLVGVANDHDLVASGDGAERVDRLDLASLIHDDQVECKGAGWKKLRDREWAHHEHWLQHLHGRRGPLDKLPYRHVTTLPRDLAPQHAKWPNRSFVRGGNLAMMSSDDLKGGRPDP